VADDDGTFDAERIEQAGEVADEVMDGVRLDGRGAVVSP